MSLPTLDVYNLTLIQFTLLYTGDWLANFQLQLLVFCQSTYEMAKQGITLKNLSYHSSVLSLLSHILKFQPFPRVSCPRGDG